MNNKKGFTLLELLICVTLVSIVIVFLFKLLSDINNEEYNHLYVKDNQINRNEIMKDVGLSIINKGLCDFNYENVSNNNTKLSFYLANGEEIVINVEPKSLTVTSGLKNSSSDNYDVYPMNAENATYSFDSSKIRKGTYNGYYYISIPIKVTQKGIKDTTLDDIEFFYSNSIDSKICGDNNNILSTATTNLISGYTLLPYLENSGQSYVDLGVTGIDNSTSIDIDFKVNDYRDNTFIFGSATEFGKSSFELYTWSREYNVNYGNSGSNYLHPAASDDRTRFVMKNGVVRMYDSYNNLIYEDTFNNTKFSTSQNNPLHIFALRRTDGYMLFEKGTVKVYSIKVKDTSPPRGINNDRNLVPCRRNSDDVKGFCDLDTSNFYPEKYYVDNIFEDYDFNNGKGKWNISAYSQNGNTYLKATSDVWFQTIMDYYTFVSGHKYYFAYAAIKNDDSNVNGLRLSYINSSQGGWGYSAYANAVNNANVTSGNYNASGNTIYGAIMEATKCNSTSDPEHTCTNLLPNGVQAIYNPKTSGTSQLLIDKVYLYDLTASFGAGNEPSLKWCDENLATLTGTDGDYYYGLLYN